MALGILDEVGPVDLDVMSIGSGGLIAGMASATGVIGTPADATPERGAALFEAAVQRSREAVRRLVDIYA